MGRSQPYVVESTREATRTCLRTTGRSLRTANFGYGWEMLKIHSQKGFLTFSLSIRKIGIWVSNTNKLFAYFFWCTLPFIEFDDGKIYRKALYLMVKTMVSCRFPLKPIHWTFVEPNHHFLLFLESWPGVENGDFWGSTFKTCGFTTGVLRWFFKVPGLVNMQKTMEHHHC